MKNLLLSLIVSIMFAPVSFGLPFLKGADFARAYETPEFIFVPKIDSNQGVVYFKIFEDKILTPSTNRDGISTVHIQLYPSAPATTELTTFLGRDWQDLKISYLRYNEKGCSINPEILSFFKGYPEVLQPKVLGGGYPDLCRAVFRMLKEDEPAFLELLKTKPAIKLDLEIPLCERDSEVVDTTGFWKELQASLKKSQKFKFVDNNDISIELWPAMLEGAKLIKGKPDLIQGGNDKQALDAFFAKFDLSKDKKSLIAREYLLNQPTTICKPRTLRVQR